MYLSILSGHQMLKRVATRPGIVVSLGLSVLSSFDACVSYTFRMKIWILKDMLMRKITCLSWFSFLDSISM